LARDAGREAAGMTARLEFAQRDGTTALSRVSLIDRAALNAGEDGRISAQRIDIAFDDQSPDPARPIVRSATAERDVRAVRGDDSIRAELVEVGFRMGDDGKAEVESFRAELGVEIALGSGEERIEAVADTVRANPLDETAELVGEPAVLRRGSGTLRGRALRLDGRRGSVDAFGPGDAEYQLAASGDGALPYERIVASWNSAMSYNDSTGEAEFSGDATLQGDQGALVRDTARAERITATFERVDAPAARSNNDNESDALPTGDRRLVRAEFLSARHEGVSESEVEIESRRYAQTANGAPTLSHLL